MDEKGENGGGFRSFSSRKLNGGCAAVVAAAETVEEEYEFDGGDEKEEVEKRLSMAEIERIEVMKMASNSTNWNRDAMDGSFEVC